MNLAAKYTSFNARGFTIIELLIVVVVIAILAAITIVGYNGINNHARESAIANKEQQSEKILEVYKINNNQYPSNQSEFDALIGQNPGDDYYTTYASAPPYTSYTISTSGSGGEGSNGAIADGSHIQTITDANCPATRTRAVDARDNHAYWVQKVADGKCWMLTNLAYAGGGTNTYGDTISTSALTNGAGNSSTYTEAKYYIPTGSNVTTEPTSPSTSTNGTGQYGYLYNWCAAMGNQQGTSACLNAVAQAPDTSVSVCPAGWRLPTGGNGGDFTALNNAVNGGSSSSDAGLIADPWLAQRSGYWEGNFSYQGSYGYYWSSTQHSTTNAYLLSFGAHNIMPADNGKAKIRGASIRCIAN